MSKGGSLYNSFGTKTSYTTKPPEKGSFPIDHDGECKQFQKEFMKCLKDNKDDSSKCRIQSMNYLACRMNNNLMERDTWKNLGYADIAKEGT